MQKEIDNIYLTLRERVLNYSYKEMNLSLDNDEQVYIAVFDVPVNSSISQFQTQSLALVYGLNTHIYHGSGQSMIGLEKNTEVMKAMQSLLISAHQVLNKMRITNDVSFYPSNYIRAYLKTRKGVYCKELTMSCKEDKFLFALMNNVFKAINNA